MPAPLVDDIPSCGTTHWCRRSEPQWEISLWVPAEAITDLNRGLWVAAATAVMAPKL